MEINKNKFDKALSGATDIQNINNFYRLVISKTEFNLRTDIYSNFRRLNICYVEFAMFEHQLR